MEDFIKVIYLLNDTVEENTMKKIVKIDVVSHSGHDTLEMAPAQAVAEIKTQVDSQNKWCLVDGKVMNADIVTAQDLSDAENIVLTDRMVGG